MFSLQVQLQKQGYYEGCRKQNEEVKTEKDKKRRSGTNRAKEWKFFTKMDGFMSQKHSANPPSVTRTQWLNDILKTQFRQNKVQTGY